MAIIVGLDPELVSRIHCAYKFPSNSSPGGGNGGGGETITIHGFFDDDIAAAAGGVPLQDNHFYKLTATNSYGLPEGTIKQRSV